MKQLTDQVAMITGASEGLGLALAEAFARAGAAVSLCARRPAPLAAARDRIADTGAPVIVEALDVTDAAGVARWFERTRVELGAPDTLINNASVLGPRMPLAEYPLDEWRRVVDVNLSGALATIQAVLPSMLERGSGSIVNVSSGAAVPPRVRWGAYAVSKTAIEALTFNLAEEMRGTGIRVNAVDPGAMRTSMRAAAYPDEDPATLKEPSSIAPVFLWLAGPDSARVSGRRIVADDWMRDR